MASHSNEYFSGSSSYSGASGSAGSGSGPGPFLEELQSRGIGVQEFQTDDAESRVTSALSDGVAKDIATIMCDSGCLPLGQLLETIGKLEQFGLLMKDGPKGNEKFSLTPSGIRAAEMMGVWRGTHHE